MPRSVFLSKQLIKNDTDRLTLISGPCLLENEKLVRQVAKSLIKYAKKEKFNLIFKCSFDKANRSSDLSIRNKISFCLLYTSPSPRDLWISRMPSSA